MTTDDVADGPDTPGTARTPGPAPEGSPPAAPESPPAAPEGDPPAAPHEQPSGNPPASGAAPPPGSTPPPGPSFGPPPGPGFAGRHGFVRPAHGRYLAGVCAGMGRATNTDPVLWRVLVVVLTLFGGIGLLLYLVAWLLFPGEGDTASPIEALVGRGDSNTSAVTVIAVAVAAVLAFVFVFSDSFHVAVLAVLASLFALLLFQRGNGRVPPGPAPFATPDPAAPPPYPAAAPPYPPAPYPSVASGGAAPSPHPSSTSAFPAQVTAVPPSSPPPYPPPYPPAPAGTQPAPPPGGYRPPFAPHGPYAGGPPPGVPPAVVRPPKPPRERSQLGRTVLSLMCLALGAAALVDLGSSGDLHASAYAAVALTVVGLGLVAGAWLGRARWLIGLGIALSVVLGITSVAESDRVADLKRGRPITWHPSSVAELNAAYTADFADATLDLRDVDFAAATTPVSVDVSIDVGRLQVLLPPNVDVDVTANIDVGDAVVLDERWGGIDTRPHRVRDDGDDGPGGGTLILDARIDAGKLEVVR